MTTEYTIRIALAVPAAQRAAANRIAEAMGMGSGCYGVPWPEEDANGNAPYWGLSTACRPSLLEALKAAGRGEIPPGVNPADVAEVLPVLLMAEGDKATTDPGEQFAAMMANAGLQQASAETSE